MNTVCRLFTLAALLLPAAPAFSTAQQNTGRALFPADLFADTTVNVSVNAKWNMVSVPLIASDMHKDTLFPSSTSNAFYFNVLYIADNDLVMGKGYWLKFSGAETIPLVGTAVHRDTFDIVAGWNLIGSISDPVPVGSITTIPEDITLSKFWSYQLGYVQIPPGPIVPGKGVWVKASAGGAIILDGGATAAPRAAPDQYSGLHKLTIEDAQGNTQTLWFGEATAKHAGMVAEMPPQPPPGIFDARYSDDNWVEFYNGEGEHRFAAKLSYAAYPITVRWEVAESDRREIVLNESVRMAGKGSVVIVEEGPIAVRVGLSGVPAVFALRQNYPNPFNPATNIAYDLPKNSAVKLAVYDLLGRQVAVLADGVETAGAHSVVFDATGFASGIYFYRLDAGAFTQTRKLMIMK